MREQFRQILENADVSPAEFALLFHIFDTVIQPRKVLAEWTFDHLPNSVPSDLTLEECHAAVDSLLAKGLIIELTEADLEADLARWSDEPLPFGFGVDFRREAGDLDLTEAGFQRITAIFEAQSPRRSPRDRVSYNHDDPKVLRIFGETAECCERAAASYLNPRDAHPERWIRAPSRIEAIRAIGPWWYRRHDLVPTGFEITAHA